MLDEDGQPIVGAFNAARVSKRQLDELIGVCKGIAADGLVCQQEAEFLARWLDANGHARAEWPGNVLFARLRDMLQDGRLDEAEARELCELLRQATGVEPLRAVAENMATALPLDRPAPAVEFFRRAFCFTGKFAFGPRRRCEEAVMDLGGHVDSQVNRGTHYVVIGLFGSRDWLHSTHGTKIKAAINSREAGDKVALISEDHWAEHLITAQAALAEQQAAKAAQQSERRRPRRAKSSDG